MESDLQQTTKRVEACGERMEAIRREMSKVLVGQDVLVNRMLMALIANGHILLEGVPGLAKTTAVKTLAQALGLDFHRISFTPDLLPADVVGTMVYDPKQGTFSPRKGPVFTHLLLADEINRAPAKVQSALLEAMQERQVTIGDQTHALPLPFLVMATQNPIEQEGTYPLPEAQVDRFMLKCKINHPSRDEERQIMARFTGDEPEAITPVVNAEDISEASETLRQVYCDDKVADYVLDIVFATRHPKEHGLDIEHLIEYGASPRASIYLNLAARANAMLNKRAYVTPQDVKEVSYDVLRHRIIPTYEAEAEDISSEDIISRVLGEIPVP